MPRHDLDMKRFIRFAVSMCFLMLIVGCGGSMSDADAPKPPKFTSPGQHQTWVVQRYIPWMEQAGGTYSSVPRADGQLLRELVEKTNRTSGLEIGSGNGYSGVWIGLGMETTGGKLVTIEMNRKRAAACGRFVKKAGLEKIVTCKRGDALKVIPRLKGPFDFMFIDVGPEDVLPFIKAVEPKLTKDPIITLHALEFAKGYTKFLNYARAKGWFVGGVKRKEGMGLVVVSPKPPKVEGLPIKSLSSWSQTPGKKSH